MYYLHHVHPASASSQSVYLENFLPLGPCLCRVLHSSLSFIALPNSASSSSSSSAPIPSSSTSSAKVNPLSEVLSLPLNARILRVVPVPPQEIGDAQKLAVLTDHHQPRLIILRYQSSQSKKHQSSDSQVEWTPIKTDSVLLLDEMGRPAAESGLNVEVEQGPGASFLFSHTHAGILKVAPLLQSSSSKISIDVDDGNTDLSRAFGVRLPHPHLISSTFLARQSASSPHALALLSLSSVASRLPGLGMQCLPVLSFHTIDEANQELKPLGWGPPRKVVPSTSSAEVVSPTSPTTNRRKSSIRGVEEMPGSFRQSSSSQEETNTSTQSSSASTTKQSNSSRYNGPGALGATRSPIEEQRHEEALIKASLTRAHVPIPFADALGAHQLLALPARAGGGVLLFCESSILHISSSTSEATASNKFPLSPKATSGKRRKASTSQTTGPTLPRRISNTSAILGTSPTSPTSAPTVRSNENGKRRRSTAGSQSQVLNLSNDATSPTTSRRASTAPSWMSRILRLELGKAIIVAASTVVCEQGSGSSDGGVQVDDEDQSKASLQVLYGTHSGMLYLLTISLERTEDIQGEPWRPVDMMSQFLGSVPAPGGPGALTYLGENFVSIASTGGDSMIVQIRSELDPQGDVEMNQQATTTSLLSLQVIHRWTNLAPILDFAVDDGAGGDPSHAKSAQARIITCSGTGPTGSLRVVRNGVGLEDILSVAEGQVRRLWSIKGRGIKEETKMLILSYHTHSRILAVDSGGGQFEDITIQFSNAGLQLNTPILEAKSLNNNTFIIINQSGVSVWSECQVQETSSWKPASLESSCLQQENISKAAANESGQIVLSISTFVVYLQVDSQGLIKMVRMEDVGSDVSALDISPLEKDKEADYATIALWYPWVVKIFKLSTWKDVTPSALTLPQPSLIRSIMLHTFTTAGIATSEPYLLLGLGDGTLNSYGLSLPLADSLVKRIGVLEKRSASMGSHPLHLRSFQTSNGLEAVFISCDRPSVVYSYGKGLQYSSVRHREVNDICQFTLQDEKMMIFGKSQELILSKMGQIQKLDVSTVELGANNPVSLTILSEARIVAAVTTTFLPEGRGTAAEEGGKVMLYDYEDFEFLDELHLEMEERPNCIESAQILGRNLLIVGTGYTFPDRSETLSGRVLLFEVTSKKRKLELVASHNVEGNTYAVGGVGEYIAACVNSKVITFEVEEEEEEVGGRKIKGAPTPLQIMQVGEWACAFTAITMRNVGKSKLVIGDALRSLVLLNVDAASGRIDELARDCDPYWTMAAEVLDEEQEEYIGCDIAFNLWTCSRVRWTESVKKQIQQSRSRNLEIGMAASDKTEYQDPNWSHIMQRQGAYHYGDLINTMRKGSLTAKSAANSNLVESRIVFGTAAGALGVIAKVDDGVAKILSQVESNLRDMFEPVGRIPADEWRTLRTDHRTQKSAGFIDGDFLNTSYDSLSSSTRATLLRSGTSQAEAEPDAINSLIESLNRLS